MMKVDTTTLSDSVTQCFDNATDGRFSTSERAAFLTEGKRLRGLLLNLLSAQFNNGTQQVVDANAELKAVNTELKAAAANIAKTASTLNNVAHLVGTLDGLLGVAVSFI
jgi:geranylgeranyl pyrophosphate synthase